MQTLAVVIVVARELLLDLTSECFMLITLTSSLCKLNSQSVDEYITSDWPFTNFLARMYLVPGSMITKLMSILKIVFTD